MVDRRERFNDNIVAVRAMMDGRLANVQTAIPGIVQSYDATKQTVVVQPAIQGQQLSPQGDWTNYTLALCLDCPVVFPSGGGFTATFPIQTGDEGLLVFSSRCIDAWWQNGGVQPQADFRMHDPSDGFFIPGARSQANKLTGVSTTTYQLRSNDGNTVLEVGTGSIKNTAGGTVTTTDTNGTTTNKTITASAGDIKASQGNIVATAGNISATAGDISAPAGTLRGIGLAITGSQTAGAGNPVLTAAGSVALTGGFTETPYNWGNSASLPGNNITLDPTKGLKQVITNNGAFTITAPAGGVTCDIEFEIVNGASAGAVSYSGFTKQWTGDTYVTTNGYYFVIFVYCFSGVDAYLIKQLYP